ncbi:MAG TPA: hypothetical protein VMW42_09420 [Desulfatiglandales bacterium]|nr:hypothetical protein [Desulfatiglandales bacterium]
MLIKSNGDKFKILRVHHKSSISGCAPQVKAIYKQIRLRSIDIQGHVTVKHTLLVPKHIAGYVYFFFLRA